jgi:energy-coupling factor transporter ATP-binding protein EcfA2
MADATKADLRLHELRADGFLKLTTVSIRPDGAMVPITGANGQGKTSVLKAFWALMQGRSAVKDQVAIKTGNDEALLFGDLGQFKVTRTIKRDKHGNEDWTLKVVGADGSRQTQKPQALLDSWLGELSFDPLAFANKMDDKGRFDTLRPLVKGFDFDGEATLRDLAFKNRTEANRRHAQAEAAANAVVLPPGKEPAEIDVRAKVVELDEAHRHNQSIADAAKERARRAAEADGWRDEAEQLRSRAATLEKRADECDAFLKQLEPLGSAIDTAALQAEMASATEVHATRALFARRREFEQAAKSAKVEADNLSTIINDSDAKKAAAIEAAKIPVKGLTLGDGVVLLNGLPFSQASTMEKIMASAAIGMAQNPGLRVMTIDEASELDSHAMAALEKLAVKHDFQILFARVDESRAVGFVIEDGEVVS